MKVLVESAGDPPPDTEENAQETASKCNSMVILPTVTSGVGTFGTGEAVAMESHGMQEQHNDPCNPLSPAHVGKETRNADGTREGDTRLILRDRVCNNLTLHGHADATFSESLHTSKKSEAQSSANPAIMQTPVKTRLMDSVETTTNSENMHDAAEVGASDTVTAAKSALLPKQLAPISTEAEQQADSDNLDPADIALLEILEGASLNSVSVGVGQETLQMETSGLVPTGNNMDALRPVSTHQAGVSDLSTGAKSCTAVAIFDSLISRSAFLISYGDFADELINLRLRGQSHCWGHFEGRRSTEQSKGRRGRLRI